MTTLTVCAPLRVEARALRRGLDAAQDTSRARVVRTGYGPARAAAAAEQIAAAGPDNSRLAGGRRRGEAAAQGPGLDAQRRAHRQRAHRLPPR